MRFLLDHCIPASVADFLRGRDHVVLILTDVLPEDAKDQVVAKTSEINDCILVTQDPDFKRIAKRIPDGGKTSVRKLSRISLQCETPDCASRIRAAISFIEFEWNLCQSMTDRRMFLVIGDHSMRTHR
jgi:predicted nuclease of predicted toxin-antitoxin system